MTNPSKTPGAMEHELHREIADGLIEFESAPVGWLKRDGERRARPWRAYYWTPAGGERRRLPSTTTILDLICPKPGIPYWAERVGIEGCLLAVRAGWVTAASRAEDAIAIVREQGLGAEAAKQRAADRGLNLHAINEAYMRTSEPPRFADHPAEHHGYLRSWAKWVLEHDPQPVAVEQLVVQPGSYAGRLDLRAVIGGALTTVDLKTQERAAIYPAAHWQVGLYERAAIACGDPPADRRLVVVLAADGEYREMAADHEDRRIDAALAYWHAMRPIGSACESANRVERERRYARDR